MSIYKNYSVVLILSKICVLTMGGQLARPVNNIRVFSFFFLSFFYNTRSTKAKD